MNPQAMPAISSLIRGYFQLYPVEAARLLENLPANDILEYLRVQSIARAAGLYAGLNPEIAAGLIAIMDPEYFSKLYSHLDASIAARLLSRIDSELQANLLSYLP